MLELELIAYYKYRIENITGFINGGRMSYTIIDLLDKFITIEQTGYEIFIANDEVQEKIKTLAKIFANEEKRHINLYKSLKEKMENEPDIEVDFNVYDKASTLIYEFSKTNRLKVEKNPRKLLETCLNFEKDTLALALSIRGIFMRSKDDADSTNYQVLTEIVNVEQKHVENIEIFLK